MLALIPLIVSLVPELARLLGGDTAGKIASSVTSIFQQVAGTTDPARAEQVAKENPGIRAQLQIRLNELVVEMQRIELQSYQAQLADVASARAATVSLAQAGSPMVWGAPIISVIVTVGFFSLLLLLLMRGMAGIDPVGAQILNIAIGSLTTGFATVVSYWLGSSRGSQEKDVTVQRLQAATAAQAQSATSALKDVVASSVAAPAPVSLPIPPATVTAPDNFDKCLAVVFAQEGGFTNRADDPGGPTNFGITIATLSEWRNKPVSEDDVRNLTQNEAKEIYRVKYWNVARCYDLPAGLDLSVFDMGVNAGPMTSVKILQRVIGVTDDGSVGPLTLAAVNRSKTGDLVPKFAEARLDYYKTLPGWATYGNGWGNRVARVRAAALAMV